MAIGTYISTVTLNVNGLNAPTKKTQTGWKDTKTTLNVNGLNAPTKKTQTGWTDTKTRPIYMLSTRNPLQT